MRFRWHRLMHVQRLAAEKYVGSLPPDSLQEVNKILGYMN